MKREFAALLLLAVALTFAAYAWAGSYTVRNACPTPRFRQVSGDLLILCPARLVTVKGCANARVLRDGAGNYKVRCG